MCFDHAILHDGRVILRAVIDSASGQCVEDFACYLCVPEHALETAQEIVTAAEALFEDLAPYAHKESNAQEWLDQLKNDLY
jgi:hypothetical protein